MYSPPASGALLTSELDIQGSWSGDSLHDTWRHTPDGKFLLRHAADAAVAAAASGAHGLLLDVAAAEADITCRLDHVFSSAVVLEPSSTMLARARAHMHQYGSSLELVRGIAESLPFADARFDRVLCHSALDHFADPERGIREMARVTKPDGRVVITFVNYGGLAPRGARVLYAMGRRSGLVAMASETQRLPWDSPVPYEHNFECTWENVGAMCRPYLELDWTRGVSMGWGFPGWGPLLRRAATLHRLIEYLDRFAQPRPALADFVVTIWRPRPRAQWPQDDYRLRGANPVYQRLIRDEAAYWAKADFTLFFGPALKAANAALNAQLTGDPARSWLDDLAARGPFRDVAVLGCDDARWDVEWLRRNVSPRLDVYELSREVIAKVQQRLEDVADRVRFVETDLNFCELPESAYDCIWASATMHCLVNLEHVLNQVHRALRPGGLFAIHGWVGENRLQYSLPRLARVNAALQQVPAQYRKIEAVARPDPVWTMGPYFAVRSEEIAPLARTHPGFDVVHDAGGWWLFPLHLVVDLAALARERPDIIMQLDAAERAAQAEPSLGPTTAYVVLRRR